MIVMDMEMPTSCAACPCADDAVRFCRAAKEYIPMLGRPHFCPLREVTESDKDKYVAWLEKKLLVNENDSD